jgi:hypothetical protein
VTLARNAAVQGAKVGFWDGSRLLKVRMYEGLAETWQEWGRSLDLKDAATPEQTWWDVAFLALVQGLPWLLTPLLMVMKALHLTEWSLALQLLLVMNGALLFMRIGMQAAVLSAYDLSQATGKMGLLAVSPGRWGGGVSHCPVVLAAPHPMARTAVWLARSHRAETLGHWRWTSRLAPFG